MSTVDALHKRAMELAQEAVTAKYYHDDAKAALAFAEAYKWEAEAAAAIATDLDGEPSRSVLHRSAAALALAAGELREAEKLVCTALGGNPPKDIAQELRKLYDRVKMLLYYEEQEIVLSENELELRLTGQAVGLGVSPSDRVIGRVRATQTLMLRTGERLRDMDFRRTGPPKKSVRDDYLFFMKVPAAASFGISLQIGAHKAQTSMPFGGTPDKVVEETLECLKLFNDCADDELRNRIRDEAYFTNFVGLAREIEPDGVDIDAVAFTASRSGRLTRVVLTGRPDRSIPPPARTRARACPWVVLTGELVLAKKHDSPGEGLIGLKDESGKKHLVVVQAGMGDVVRSHWEDMVTIAGHKIRGRVHLERIGNAAYERE